MTVLSHRPVRAAPRTLVDDEAGTTAIEYGLIAGLIGVALIAVLMNMNGTMITLYSAIEYIAEVL